MVNLFFEETEVLDLNPEFFVSWLHKVCSMYDKKLGDLSLIFCSDDYLLIINQEHLAHDYYTDIITFDYTDDQHVSGDLFISVDRVHENAKDMDIEFGEELNRVVVHGVLHMLGFKDKTSVNKKEMTLAENKALKLIVPRET